MRLNPRRLRYPDPAAGLRDGVDTLERAAIDLRVLARAVADSARLDSDDSPVKDPETRARLAAVIAELAAGVSAYGQLIEAGRPPAGSPQPQTGPIAEELEDHLEEAQRQQDRLADLLATDPAERPDGWPLRGEILAHLDRLRGELEPRRPSPPGPAAQAAADAAPPAQVPGQAEGLTARSPALPVVDGLDVVTVGIAQEHGVVAGVVLRPFAGGMQDLDPGRHRGLVHGVDRGPVGRAERNVQFPGLVPGGRAQPERGDAVRTGQADYEAVTVREAHHLAHPDRGKGPQVEAERRLDVARLQAQVI